MLNKFFGIFDSYTTMIVIGVIFAFALAIIFLRYKKFSKREYLDLLICASGAVLFGIIFAILFQNLYDVIEYQSAYKWQFRMTFFGGLFGGVLGFLFIYYVFLRKATTLRIGEVLKIAPACVTLGHAFGRVGCFLSPCCYGKASEKFGLYFPELGYKAIPTQMYEFIFLFILSGVLIFMAFKKDFKYSFVIYLAAYSIFRFIIEFFRGDDRGAFFVHLSPSQIWCIVLLVATVPLILLVNKTLYKAESYDKE